MRLYIYGTVQVSQNDYDPDQTSWTDTQKTARAIVDSGTNGISVPTSVHDALIDAIVAGVSPSANPDYVRGFQDPGHFLAPAEYNPNEDFPMLRFWVKDVDGKALSLDLAPQQYRLRTSYICSICRENLCVSLYVYVTHTLFGVGTCGLWRPETTPTRLLG